jgi:DNA-binding CsgD family transcriptional regulator
MTQRSDAKTAVPTQREQELINLVTRGLQNKEIAFAMKISENTVKAHIANILRKYSLHNRTQIAMTFAMQAHLTLASGLHRASTDGLVQDTGATIAPEERGDLLPEDLFLGAPHG